MRQALCVAATALVLGCSPPPSSGPVEIAWDRDTCDRCSMVIGDRRFAAQVRGADAHVHRFDDLGCALVWIEGEGAEPKEIWVRDLEGARWLAAEESRYVSVEGTPMNYGFGAVEGPSDGSLGLDEVRERVLESERGRRSHAH